MEGEADDGNPSAVSEEANATFFILPVFSDLYLHSTVQAAIRGPWGDLLCLLQSS